MAEDFGSGVSRTLSALQRQFQTVVWQSGRPPLDAELNLMSQVDAERVSRLIRSTMHSGFLLDPTTAQKDFHTDPSWSDFFKLGRADAAADAPALWANVNGWLVPITGTATSEGDPTNRVDLFPPPSSDARIDLVFLEVWLAQVAPNPSTDNKPSASKVWKYGNVKYGGTNIDDDIEDPAIGFETTERVQIQYRLRVFGSGSGLGTSVDLENFPDGLDDPNVVGQGTSTAPVVGTTFTNMGDLLGDPGLWRAGSGDPTNDLATVDGYTYAIPVAALFRRNSDPFVAQTASGNPNQNGAVDRNPTTLSFTDPAAGTTVLGTATLTNDIDEDDTGNIQITDLVGSGLENTTISWASMFLILDDEVISIESVDTSTTPGTIKIRTANGRGRWGTMAVPHDAGTTVKFFNWRHDGLFGDQIADTDILDLRRSVSLGEWDHQRLLTHNLTKLFRGELRTSYKQGIGDTQGPFVVEVDTLDSRGAVLVPNQTEALDGPDGIRTIYSDAAAIQPDVTMLLDDPLTLASGSPGAIAQYDAGTVWDVGADFLPGGFVVGGDGWRNGDSIFVYIGGADGTGGARGTFRTGSERAVRFLTPLEYWLSEQAGALDGNQHPISIRFLSEEGTEPAGPGEVTSGHPGPLYPLKTLNFEKPYIVLGGILNSDSINTNVTVVPESAPSAADWEVTLSGVDFDISGDWYSGTAPDFDNDPDGVTKPVLQGTRTLYGMLTNNGRDRTGASSEIYLVIWGDDTTAPLTNNGVFRVVGAGTVGFTTRSGTAANSLRVEFVSQGVTDFTGATGLNAELRSQYTHSNDGNGSAGASTAGSAMCVVLTDIEGVTGGTTNPWNGLLTEPVSSRAVLRTALQYHPGRGGTARVADALHRAAIVTGGSEYLRRAPGTLDTTFPAAAGVPDDETYFDLNHIQTWNRLSSRGLDAPEAPAYGGQIVSFTEQDRESELFVDAGSKTLMFRPFLYRDMTMRRRTATADLFPSTYTLGHNVDGAGIFSTTRRRAYAVPPEYMPRFGRHDIPYYADPGATGTGTFLAGVNHLFLDTIDPTDPQFNIVGGRDNGGSGGINPILFQTTNTTLSGLDYGEYGAIPPGSIGSAFQCRLYVGTDVVSSDLGRVLRGIQLPPFYGIARLYGVYERTDYENSGASGTMFDSNRFTPIGTAAPNLLRTDADKQTLFILENGGDNATGGTGDHTYIIPSDAIDFRLSNSHTPGTDFEDYEYIIEAVVFGFARGFINGNNYVVARRNKGAVGGGNDLNLEGLGMVLPAAAPVNDRFYIAYNRTPYQGDPYMTRDGGTRTALDYTHRYGQIDPTNSFELGTSIQQFDSNGNTIIETPNARAFEVLASLDFWTTLGTGKVGGALFPGTPLDVGHVQNTLAAAGRVPPVNTAPPWQVGVRAFTEGQRNNLNHARLTITLVTLTGLVAGDGLFIQTPTGITSILAGTDYVIAGTVADTVQNIVDAINGVAAFSGVLRAAESYGSPHIQIIAEISGAGGGQITVRVNNATTFAIALDERETAIGTVTTAALQGGVDIPVNSGDGTSSQELTGLIERLPLGILIQDSDFICEDLIRDGTGQLQSFAGGIGVTQLATPLVGGEEYTRLVGGPGQWIGMADGGVLRYAAYRESPPPGSLSGTRKFRIFRGGGSTYVLTEPNPGGPVDWISGHLPESYLPVLKGGVLACKALLVRNYPEVAFSGSEQTSYGDEIQMVVLTRAILGKGGEDQNGVSLTGLISPTGYGEGYAAADRYRLEGKPLVASQGRSAPDVDPELAVFPFSDLTTNIG